MTGDLADLEGKAVDISMLGSSIASDTTVKKGTYQNLRFHLPQDKVPMKVELAVVRWAHGGKFGVEFIRMYEQEQERLKRLLKTLEMASA